MHYNYLLNNSVNLLREEKLKNQNPRKNSLGQVSNRSFRMTPMQPM